MRFCVTLCPLWVNNIYIKIMKEKLTLIKVGGKIVEEETTLYKLLDDFAALKDTKVLVHGGGRSATKQAERLGIESHMVNGRRINRCETLKVVTMSMVVW